MTFYNRLSCNDGDCGDKLCTRTHFRLHRIDNGKNCSNESNGATILALWNGFHLVCTLYTEHQPTFLLLIDFNLEFLIAIVIIFQQVCFKRMILCALKSVISLARSLEFFNKSSCFKMQTQLLFIAIQWISLYQIIPKWCMYGNETESIMQTVQFSCKTIA